MNRSVSVLALGAKAWEQSEPVKDLLSTKSGIPTQAISFTAFEEQKALLKALKGAFESADTVIICADLPDYLPLKGSLFKILNFESQTSDLIEATINIFAPENSQEIKQAHSILPDGAIAFPSDDGLFSAFASKAGSQNLVFAPLDCSRLEATLELGLSAYLKDQAAPIYPNARQAVSNFASEGGRIAVVANRSSRFLQLALHKLETEESVFDFLEFESQTGEKKDPKASLADWAKEARDKSGNVLGLALSDIYKDKKDPSKLFIFLAFVGPKGARVVKINSKPGESARLLVRVAIAELFSYLGEFSPLKGTFIPNNIGERPRRAVALKIALPLLAAIVLSLLIVFFGGRMTNSAREFFDKLSSTLPQTTDFQPDIKDTSTEATTNESSLESTRDELSSDDDSSAVSGDADKAGADLSSEKLTVKNTTLANIIGTLPSSPATTKVKDTTTTKTTTATTSTTTSTTATSTKTTLNTTATDTKVTSTAPSSTPGLSGGFTFTTKGYGHGVGLSQEGAKTMAKQGHTYVKILEHYFPGSKVMDDTWPDYISYGTTQYSAEEYLIRTAVQEIGASSPLEALKAQAVAAYNFAKMYGFEVPTSQSALSKTFDVKSNSNAKKAVQAVRDKYLVCNGQLVQAYYFASSAGKTVSSSSVWGGTSPTYLKGGVSSPETVSVDSKTFTTEEFAGLVNQYNAKYPSKKITLGKNPQDWIEIKKTDSVGYVEDMRVGDRTMNGNYFRFYVMGLGIRSHSFTLTYVK